MAGCWTWTKSPTVPRSIPFIYLGLSAVLSSSSSLGQIPHLQYSCLSAGVDWKDCIDGSSSFLTNLDTRRGPQELSMAVGLLSPWLQTVTPCMRSVDSPGSLCRLISTTSQRESFRPSAFESLKSSCKAVAFCTTSARLGIGGE